MAELINLAGTTSHSFTIGQDGVTTFYGIATPINDMGKVGDIYIQLKKEINDVDTVSNISGAEDSLQSFKAEWEEKHPGQTLDKNHLVKYVGDSTSTYYKWDGTNIDVQHDYGWLIAFHGTDELGRVWYKEIFDGNEQWNFVKSYTFDDDIIKVKEVSPYSNNFRMELESADNSSSLPSDDNDPNTQQTSYGEDYDVNRTAYGVTRYGSDAEVTVSANDKSTLYNNYKTYTFANLPTIFDSTNDYMPDKFIAVTPAQMADNLKVEMSRAIKVEGNLSALNSDGDLANSTSLSDAIHREYNRAYGVETGLQQQINAITSKSDVADVVETYADLVDYDASNLFSDDVIKVLKDETANDATTYYRFSPVPSTPNVSVSTYAALLAYPTSGLVEGNVALVASDESFTPAKQNQYYEWRKVNGTLEWAWAGPKTNNDTQHPDVKYYWDYIGKEGSYYTKGEADARFVNATEDVSESITGVKTFNNNDLKIKSTSIDADNTSTAGTMKISFIDKKVDNQGEDIGVDMGYVKSELTNDNKIVSSIGSTRVVNSSAVNSTLSTVVESNGTTYATAPSPTASNATTGNNKIATVEWVNNPTLSTNVVHRSGNEEIGGNKTFTGTVTVIAPTSNMHAATKKYVDDGLSPKLNRNELPALSSSAEGQLIACKEDPNNPGNYKYDWKIVKDISTVDGLEDTIISNKANDQSLVWDATAASGSGAWVNKRPTVATISYW